MNLIPSQSVPATLPPASLDTTVSSTVLFRRSSMVKNIGLALGAIVSIREQNSGEYSGCTSSVRLVHDVRVFGVWLCISTSYVPGCR